MKKTQLAVLLAFIFGMSSIQAQTWQSPAKYDYSYGIALTFGGSGGKFEQGSFSQSQDLFNKFTTGGGVYAFYALSEDFGLKADILYSNKGFTIEYDVNGQTEEKDLSVSSISLPVSLQFNIVGLFSVGAGYEYSFIIDTAGDLPFGPEFVESTGSTFLFVGLAAGEFDTLPLMQIKWNLSSGNISNTPAQTIEINTLTYQLNIALDD